ncbi:hypothetical protein amrb99_97690 [Actinomadura sp. RB99]|uniref:phage tail tube protein n=1 Tax=Actinomadura sp. RB99 TaxID=2691577 RepID=UPI0016844D10|nr:hypothetical protein [Actinomadura sp. RB99]MBD2900760.1 hypothetical protein [Actinomadura sp. RB99]
MPATPIAAEERYFERGVTKVYFLTAITAPTKIPTRTELNAGKDITEAIADIDGWKIEGDDIETPDLGSRFKKTIPGELSADDSSLTCYRDAMGLDIRTLLPRGTKGYVVWLDAGDVEDGPMDIFPVRVKSLGKSRTVDTDAANIEVTFSILDEPVEDASVPATTP